MAIFDPILNALGWLLSIFYAVIPDIGTPKQDYAMGVAIILLTFTIMLLLYPLTAKQARSMIAMQMVQPEIKRIQAKHKNDRAKLNEEMMKFYQENKINPLAGCLPLLVQLPIFFALFNVLRNPYEYVPRDSGLYKALCTVGETGRVVGEKACGNTDGLPAHQKFLGMDLSVSAPNQLGTWASVLAFLLVVLVMLTGYLQSRQAQKRTPAINKQMAVITKVLPVFFGFISLNFPSGLVLYFFVSNLWRLGQQEVIFRHIGTAANPKHKSLLHPRGKVLDAESRERGPDDSDTTPALKAPAPGKDVQRRGSKANGADAPAKPVIGPSGGGGGLRGLFKPPPPASGAPATRPAAKPSPANRPSAPASGVTSRPGEAGRRGKKKRKR
jgi:YidC/Oxa1 family membrane protein insertase